MILYLEAYVHLTSRAEKRIKAKKDKMEVRDS